MQPYTRDRSLLRGKVKAIQPTQRPTRLEEALILAAGLANPARSTDDAASRPAGEEAGKARTYVASEGIPTEVFLFSDGRFPDVPDFNLGNLSVQYRAMGEPGPEAADNVGIVTLNAARDERDPGRLLVFAQVANFRSVEARVQIDLEVFVNGAPPGHLQAAGGRRQRRHRRAQAGPHRRGQAGRPAARAGPARNLHFCRLRHR